MTRRPGRLTVLLAEDDLVSQRLATIVLQRLGHDTRVVDDGRAALEAVLAEDIELVLMDVQMPVMDGLEATRRIRATTPPDRQPWIVAMTANGLTEHREACLAAGMDDFLSKPLDAEELRLALARVSVRHAGPGAAPAHPGHAVDASVLDTLTARFGDRSTVVRTRLIQTWRTEATTRLAEATAAAAAGDADGVRRVAHTLKGGSASLGALPLAELCDQVEARLRAGEAGDLRADAAALAEHVSTAVAAFDALWPPTEGQLSEGSAG